MQPSHCNLFLTQHVRIQSTTCHTIGQLLPATQQFLGGSASCPLLSLPAISYF